MTSSSKDSSGGHLGIVLIGAALLLTLLTLLNFIALDRFEAAGEPVSVLPAGGLTLQNEDRGAIVRHDLPLRLPDPTAFVKIEAVAEGWDMKPGDRPWQRGRIVFLRHGLKGDIYWDKPHVVALLKGNPIRWTFIEVFSEDRRATGLMARIELLRTSGTMKVYSLTATPMREAHGFRALAEALMLLWAGLGGLATWWIWRRAMERRWLIVLAWLVAAPALMLSVLPGQATNPARTVAMESIDLVASEDAGEKEREAALSANMFSIAKSGHVVMFFLVGFFIMLARGRAPLLLILMVAAGYAGLCEMLQLFSPDRTPAAFDVMLNIVSAAVGALLALVLAMILRRSGLFQPV